MSGAARTIGRAQSSGLPAWTCSGWVSSPKGGALPGTRRGWLGSPGPQLESAAPTCALPPSAQDWARPWGPHVGDRGAGAGGAGVRGTAEAMAGQPGPARCSHLGAKWGWGCGALLCFLLWCLRREGHLRLLVCGAGGGDLHTWGLDPPPLLPVPLTAPFSRVEQAPQEQLSGHGVSHQALMKLGTGASSLGCAPCGFGGSLGRAQGGPRTKP